MNIAAEITSVLQCIFLLSLISKKFKNEKDLNIDFMFLNKYVNIETIQITTKIIKTKKYKFNFLDIRNANEYIIKKNKSEYDILILRSRLLVKVHNYFCISNIFFIETGNCKISQLVQKYYNYKKIFTVDDGLSNWENIKYNYLNLLLSNFYPNTLKLKRFILPKIFKKITSNKAFINHFSIFANNYENNIGIEFKEVVKILNKKLISKNLKIKNLFIGIWPNFPDRNNESNDDKQIFFLKKFIEENINFQNEIIYVKDHPKHKINDKLIKGNFIRLDDEYLNFPFEILLPSFPNLRNIIGFPSTALMLANYFNKNNISIRVLNKNMNNVYYDERTKLILNNNKNAKIINF